MQEFIDSIDDSDDSINGGLKNELKQENKLKQDLISFDENVVSYKEIAKCQINDIVNFNEIHKQGLNDKLLVRYNKEPFKKLIFTNFTSCDFNLFMVLCFVANDKGSLKIRLDFNTFCVLANKKEKNKKRLNQQINDFAKKCSKTIIKLEKEESKSYISLFEFIEVFDDYLIFKFNPFMLSVVNNFRFYTQFELSLYCLLKSKYSKMLYLLLLDNLYKGKVLKISVNNFMEYFDLSLENARNLERNIINLAVNELLENKLFKKLSYKKETHKSYKIMSFYVFEYSR
ncbi:replication initiation protein [Campylobacter troglodytis]|uniref:replication initiation protein n=1 Tax=Campylobacter troglodytis TaxID=654363 RepID=UPI00115C21C3|nr:replication initiation protein [Campylobacter troglodytis]TQR51242.1 hypothetical protein DMC01_12715 [Campylobacter troglodytis]